MIILERFVKIFWVFIAVLFCLWLFLHIKPMRTVVSNFIASKIGPSVVIAPFKGVFPFYFSLPYISISDSKGIWIQIEDVKFLKTWIIPFNVKEFNVRKIHIKRKPVFSSNISNKNFTIPFSINISDININKILFNEKTIFSYLRGNFFINSNNLQLTLDNKNFLNLSKPFNISLNANGGFENIIANIKFNHFYVNGTLVAKVNFKTGNVRTKINIKEGLYGPNNYWEGNLKGNIFKQVANGDVKFISKENNKLVAEAKVNLDFPFTKNKFYLKCFDLSKYNHLLKKSLYGEVVLNGYFSVESFNNFNLQTYIHSKNFTYNGVNIGNVEGDFLVQDIPILNFFVNSVSKKSCQKPVNASFNLNCEKKKVKVSIKGIVDFIPYEEIFFKKIVVENGKNNVQADVKINLKNFLTQGDVNINIQSLKDLSYFLEYPIRGKVFLTANLNYDKNKQIGDIFVRGEKIKGIDWSIEQLKFKSKISDFLNQETNLSVINANYKDFFVYNSNIFVEGSIYNFIYKFNVKGKYRNNLKLEANGHLDYDKFLKVLNIEGAWGDHNVKLLKPIVLSRTENFYKLREFLLMISSGEISFLGNLSKNKVDGSLKIEKLPLAFFHNIDNTLPKEGFLYVNSIIKGDVFQPDISLRLKVKKSERSDGIIFLNTQISKGQLSFTGKLNCRNKKDITTTDVNVNATFPIKMSLIPWHFEIRKDKKFKLTALGHSDLEVFERLIYLANNSYVKGRLILDVIAGGTINKPALNGSFKLQNGYLENNLIGLVLKDFEMFLHASNDKILLEKFSGQDGKGGNLNIQGSIDISKKDPYANFNILLKDFRLLRLDELKARTVGSLNLEGNMSNLLLSGDITASNLEVMFQDVLNEIPVLEISEEFDLEEKKEYKKEYKEIVPINLNLNIDFPNTIKFIQYGIISEWGGNLSINGGVYNPEINGKLLIVPKKYMVLGKVFDVKKGEIIFDKTTGLSPYLSIISHNQIGDNLVKIKISGEAIAPIFELSSSPYASQEDIVSLLLYGRKRGEISFSQGLFLVNALTNLKNKGANKDFFSQFRTITGADIISVEQKEDQDGPTLRIGKQISKNVSIILDQSIHDSKAILDIKLTPTLSLETELGFISQLAVGIFKSWRY